tara:strand:+ start:161 stop:403 length:243 start_codon:yes stop_codon:yes gene_type:complete
MSLHDLGFLVDICIAISVLNTLLLIFVLLFNMSISGKINRQADVISFIHKRAKVAERREDNMMDAAANQRRQGNKKVEKK